MRERTLVITSLVVLAGALRLLADPYSSVDAKDGWKLATNSNDVMIYSRVRSGSPLKEFRAIGRIDASTHAVHAVIDDIESYSSFMPYIAECRLIKREGDAIITY